ncbi:MAG: fucose isomerase [Candidatus Rifleibacteriota bacterium]
MKVGIFYISSDLHEQIRLKNVQDKFFSILKAKTEISEIEEKDFGAQDLIIVAILTGGTERKFLEIWHRLKSADRPFLLAAFNSDNSLPAAMEIQGWLQLEQQYQNSKILHGDFEQIAEQVEHEIKKLRIVREVEREVLGVIGEPSDWLIASKADYRAFEKKLKIRFNDISMTEFLNLMQSLKEESSEEFRNAFSNFINEENKNEFAKAEKIFRALRKTMRNYCLSALTIRCFDILESDKTTGCLALSLLNDLGVLAGCEGDVPAAVSMIIAKKAAQRPVFMANPSRISENEVVFAHCSAPCSILKNYHIDTHFESGIGLAVSGEFELGPVTIFRIDNKARYYTVTEGEIVPFAKEQSLCRTQIRVKLKNASELLLQKPLGNHQIIVQGYHARMLKDLCKIWMIEPYW